jgi:hypothetical protein
MARPKRYSGNTTVRINDDGTVDVTTKVKYPSIEASGIVVNNQDIINAMNKPGMVVLDFPIRERKFA